MDILLTIIMDDDPQSGEEAYRQAVQGIRDSLMGSVPPSVRIEYKSAVGKPLVEMLSRHLRTITGDSNNSHFVALFLCRTLVNLRLATEIDMLYGQLKNRLQIFCFSLPDAGYETLARTLHDLTDTPKIVYEVRTLSQKNADQIVSRLRKRTIEAAQEQAAAEQETRPHQADMTVRRLVEPDDNDRPESAEDTRPTPVPQEQQPISPIINSGRTTLQHIAPLPASPPRKENKQRRSNSNNPVQALLEEKKLLTDVVYAYRPTPGKEVDPYGYPETERDQKEGLNDRYGTWVIAGASIRGRGHQNKGTHRDDAFAIETAGRWHILALSDGAGSAEFSRVTAHESVRVAVDAITQAALPITTDTAQVEQRMQAALQKAVREVYRTQESWNKRLGVDKKATYCTLQLLIHQPLEDGGCVIGTMHVGDGVICATSAEVFNQLTQGDHGADASTTHFVLSFPLEKLLKRLQTHVIDTNIEVFALMSDGIEDDLKPSTEQYVQGERMENNAEKTIRGVKHNILAYPCWQDWGEILQDSISYERPNSNDDRTLIVLTRRPEETNGC